MIDLSSLDFPRPIVIAEIGGNHEGHIDKAYELARLAAENGADVVKFQTYTADGLVNAKLTPERHQHFRRFELPNEEWPKLAGYVRSLGVEWLTSLWDPELFDLIEPLVPAFKIGSGDITNWPFLHRCLDTGKPLILSTAMCDLDDVRRTVDFLIDRDPDVVSNRRLALLQCTAQYDDPEAQETNVSVMKTFERLYPGVITGFSNHYVGLDACRAALALGATILEVHFTTDRGQGFRDHRLSVLPDELAQLRELCEVIPALVGDSSKDVTLAECDERARFRRALFLRRDAEAGTTITEQDLIALRPEVGIPASNYREVVGLSLAMDVKALEPLSPDLFKRP